MNKCTIVLHEKGQRYKVSKIIFYSDNAGFGILCPYHAARKGYLIKATTGLEIYNKYGSPTHISFDDQLQYSANDRVKLSIHTDGFVQFSGENHSKIISGRDAETGEAKGMGIFTSPLAQPIMPGPTFAITIWGLDNFSAFEKPKAGELVVEFPEDDYEYRETNEVNYNGYIVEGFVFPRMFWSFSFVNELNQEILKFKHPYFQHDPYKSLTFKVLPFVDSDLCYMIALLVSRARLQMPQDSKTGFILNSPTQIKGNIVTSMYAFYPATALNMEKARSLDYRK